MGKSRNRENEREKERRGRKSKTTREEKVQSGGEKWERDERGRDLRMRCVKNR